MGYHVNVNLVQWGRIDSQLKKCSGRVVIPPSNQKLDVIMVVFVQKNLHHHHHASWCNATYVSLTLGLTLLFCASLLASLSVQFWCHNIMESQQDEITKTAQSKSTCAWLSHPDNQRSHQPSSSAERALSWHSRQRRGQQRFPRPSASIVTLRC